MKMERFISKLVKGIRIFSILCIGMMLAMFVEFGFEAVFVINFVLSLILCICTSIKIKEDAETEESL